MRSQPSPKKEVSAGFFRSLGGTLLLLATGSLWLTVGLWPNARAQALGKIVYNDYGYYRLNLALTPGRWWALRGLLLGATLLGAALLAGSRQTNLLPELRAAGRRAVNRIRRWPRPAAGIATGLVLLLLAARLWYVLQYPLSTDEVGSYDFFVAHGPLAISSYYPIPNNHILYNLLVWPGFALGLPPRWVMRLPTLLLGTAGTVAGYLLLARVVRLRLATLVTGLVGLGPLWVYFGAVGRGYFIQFGLLQLGFFAALELLRPATRYRELAWAAFVASSILGLYTIPTYAYPLVGLGLVLAIQLTRQRRLIELVWASLIIGTVSLLLYAPVGAVSGWDRLLGNRYVATRSAAQFWPAFRAVLYEMGAELFGPSLRLSGPAWLGAALLGGWAARWLLPAGPRRQTAMLAWVLLATPLLLMAGQRVYMPTRALLYLTFAGYLLLALLATRAARRATRPFGLFRWPLIVAVVLGTGGLRLYRNLPQLRYSRHETQLLTQAYQWLRQQPTPRPARVWLRAPLQALFFAHYNQTTNGPHPHLTAARNSWPGQAYDFIVLGNRFPAPAADQRAGYRLAYHDELISIYAHR
ncbi:hypothetical protein MON38_08965 [Hymenobacter sp. DH14]|uniref:Glycosyltransferase RgtA/B/C/D-like domain-containing protein n=1 Tax=Hymenobacter cyanobacteriorum TaxID=2926463 RepID=A0A9X1VG83_9BACT|nr:hypothetical protein [Hymenobacter cyanobacteriorum]MCI1187548.1 hypothetical protein [Hymenobacter cyanobacteriorum]